MVADEFRVETDALGDVEVPVNAYYGAFTARAVENFQISESKAPKEFIHAFAQIKKAAAQANAKLGVIDEERATAIVNACDEVLRGKFSDHFPLDFFQAGAGTPFHMNVNEVLANRASELLGSEKGSYYVDPHDHVNAGQSSNNVVPTAIRLTILHYAESLLDELERVAATFQTKATAYNSVVKVGRTHLQDATPVTYGQVFESYAEAVRRSIHRIEAAVDELREVGIGGTATGTGVTAHPKFRGVVVKKLGKITGEKLWAAEDGLYVTWSAAPFLHVSTSLRTLAVELSKIADDLRLLNSGPLTGLKEVDLPEVEPGSSIMPGKVNPSILESVNMICFEVIGNDAAVCEAARSGELELNVFTPVIAKNLFESFTTLTNGLEMFREKCLHGLNVDKKVCEEYVEHATSIVTALNPYLGYDVGAEVVKIALQEDRTVEEVITKQGLMDEVDVKRLLSAENTTQPGEIDEALREAVQSSDAYKDFRDDRNLH